MLKVLIRCLKYVHVTPIYILIDVFLYLVFRFCQLDLIGFWN